MNEFTVVLKNLPNKGYGITVGKIDSYKDGIVITKVEDNNSSTYEKLKVGDHIVRVNNKSAKNNRNKLLSEINDSKSESVTLVIQRNKKDFHHRSDNNLSSSICSVNNNSQTFRSSKSSIDLNASYQTSKKILDSNYIPEDQIKNFIQDDYNNVYGTFYETSVDRDSNFYPLSNDRSLISLNDSDSTPGSRKHSNCVSPVPPVVQVTRKQAYKKSIDDAESIYQSQQPRINRKKATNAVIIAKDPVVIMKKKTNAHIDMSTQISRNSSANLNSKTRYPPTPIARPSTNWVIQNDINLNSSQPSPQNNDSEDGMSISKPKRSPNLSKDTPASKEVIPSRDIIECEMKITLFNDKKITKPNWKKYWLEKHYFGINFECSDLSQTQLSSNSTALNPSIASPDLIMNVWEVNNSITKFYLPFYQSNYDELITRVVTLDEIKINFSSQKLEFFIKINEDTVAKLCEMLQVTPPESKPPAPIKHKKSIGSIDAIRPEPRKMKQPPKPIIEKLFFSSLQKTAKVEGVPLIVILCSTLIEEIGLKEEGIYRKSGNINGRKVLEEAIINESPEKWSSHVEWTNVNTVSSVFKGFLRKYTLLDKDTAIKLSTIKLNIDESIKHENDKQIQEIMDMIYHLTSNFKSAASTEENKCRLDTFKYIIKHLYRVSLCHEFTKMNAENLATIFVPNLIEDIPQDDDVQYKESRKNVAHENLTKMVTFWITYADTMCEMLEEDKPEELNKKVLNFLKHKHLMNCTNIMNIDKGEIDLMTLVKGRIEFYTEDLCPVTSTTSPKLLSYTNTPDNYFTRNKNSRVYQSLKQPRTAKNRRRNNSGSSMDMVKPVAFALMNQENESKSPIISKKPVNSELWSSKNLKKPNKELTSGNASGIKISSLHIAGNKKNIPLVVAVCIDIVEHFGLQIDGIYRISGRNQDINSLDALVMDNDIEKWIVDANIKIWANLHNTACLLKKVLKKFCLIPKDTWMHMSSQFSEKLEPDDVKKVLKAAAYHLRAEIPKPNMYHSTGKINFEDNSDIKQCEARFRSGTLRYVLKHLRHISRHESDNRMTSNSLAVCFVPVLMEEDYSTDMMVTNTKCIQIVQLLIDHCLWIFQWDFRPPQELYGQTMTDSLDNYLKDYKSTPCHCTKCEDIKFVADNNEIKDIIDRLIETSYLCEEFGINNLVMYFDSQNLSASPRPETAL